MVPPEQLAGTQFAQSLIIAVCRNIIAVSRDCSKKRNWLAATRSAPDLELNCEVDQNILAYIDIGRDRPD
jgi:hypothetical protein